MNFRNLFKGKNASGAGADSTVDAKQGSKKGNRGAINKNARLIRQQKIEEYFKKRGKHEEKKAVEEPEGREPVTKEQTSRPEEQQPALTVKTDEGHLLSPKEAENKPTSVDDNDDDQASNVAGGADSATSVGHLDEKKTDTEPSENFSSLRLTDSAAGKDEPAEGGSSKPDAPQSGSTSAGGAPPTPSSHATPKKDEPRDPPPSTCTPDVAFCGCF